MSRMTIFGHKHQNWSDGGELDQVAEEPLPLESAQTQHFYNLGHVFGCFSNIALENNRETVTFILVGVLFLKVLPGQFWLGRRERLWLTVQSFSWMLRWTNCTAGQAWRGHTTNEPEVRTPCQTFGLLRREQGRWLAPSWSLSSWSCRSYGQEWQSKRQHIYIRLEGALSFLEFLGKLYEF